MNCNEARPLLEAYLDGELDLVHSLAIEQHVASCPNCRRAREQYEVLRESIRTGVPRMAAPPELVGRLREALRRETGKQERKIVNFVDWRWLAVAAAIVVAIAFLRLEFRQTRLDPLVAEVVSSHVRSLMPGHLTDVVSSDRHTVKPWIALHVDYSPPVLDLAAEGFPLLGARLDYLENRTVAALVYGSREHRINLFISPNTTAEAELWQTRDGFHVGMWSHAGMRFVVVSDLAEPELRAFSGKFRDGVK
jgi:anti-sigma factor RsiW